MVKLFSLSVLYKGINSAIWLKSAYDLTYFGFFQRGSVQEFMAFVSKTIVERTQAAARQSVKEGEYTCHVYVRADNLAGVLISDHEYPHRVAHTLITKKRSKSVPLSGPVVIQAQALNIHSTTVITLMHLMDGYCSENHSINQISIKGDSCSADNQAAIEFLEILQKVLDEFAAKIPASEWPGGTEATINYTQLPFFLSRYQNPHEADAMTKIQDELEETKIILHNTIDAVLQRGEKLDDLVSKSEGLSVHSKAFYKTARKTNSCCSYVG